MNTTLTAPPMEEPSQEAKVKKHPVIEIFGPVIQGEGSQCGQQTMFIRFGGCDYRCKMCDSLHAVDPHAIIANAKWMEPTEIVRQLEEVRERTGVNWVTFSGGNPCMHKLDELVAILTTNGWHINVETQGTLWQDWLYSCMVVTVSPKSWGMGEKFEEDKYRKFLEKLNGTRPLCVKVVVFSEQDLEFALSIYQITEDQASTWLYTHGPYSIAYYLSVGNFNPPKLTDDYQMITPTIEGHLTLELLKSYRRLSEELLQDPRLKAFRFLPQLHVLVYGNETGR